MGQPRQRDEMLPSSMDEYKLNLIDESRCIARGVRPVPCYRHLKDSDKKILLNIKDTKIFNTLDLVEKNFFDIYTKDKIKRLKQIEKASIVQSKRLGLFVDMF